MAQKVKVKRYNGSSFDLVHPETSWDNIVNKPSFADEDHTHTGSDITTGEFDNIDTIELSDATGKKMAIGEENEDYYVALRDDTSWGGYIGYKSEEGVHINAGSQEGRGITLTGSNPGFGGNPDFEIDGDGNTVIHGGFKNSSGDKIFEEDGDTLIIRDNE